MSDGIMKRHPDKSIQKLTRFKGEAHSMHRKDGVEGDAKGGKLEYADVGEKYEPFASAKDKKRYPSMTIPAGKMPSLADSKIGEEVELVVKAKVTGAHHTDERGARFELEVQKVALHKDKA